MPAGLVLRWGAGAGDLTVVSTADAGTGAEWWHASLNTTSPRDGSSESSLADLLWIDGSGDDAVVTVNTPGPLGEPHSDFASLAYVSVYQAAIDTSNLPDPLEPEPATTTTTQAPDDSDLPPPLPPAGRGDRQHGRRRRAADSNAGTDQRHLRLPVTRRTARRGRRGHLDPAVAAPLRDLCRSGARVAVVMNEHGAIRGARPLVASRGARFLVVVLAVPAVVAAACGGGDESSQVSTAPAAPAADPAPAPQPAPAPAPAAAPGNDIPEVTVVNVVSGDSLVLSSLAPADRPILLWFWAPH